MSMYLRAPRPQDHGCLQEGIWLCWPRQSVSIPRERWSVAAEDSALHRVRQTEPAARTTRAQRPPSRGLAHRLARLPRWRRCTTSWTTYLREHSAFSSCCCAAAARCAAAAHLTTCSVMCILHVPVAVLVLSCATILGIRVRAASAASLLTALEAGAACALRALCMRASQRRLTVQPVAPPRFLPRGMLALGTAPTGLR